MFNNHTILDLTIVDIEQPTKVKSFSGFVVAVMICVPQARIFVTGGNYDEGEI